MKIHTFSLFAVFTLVIALANTSASCKPEKPAPKSDAVTIVDSSGVQREGTQGEDPTNKVIPPHQQPTGDVQFTLHTYMSKPLTPNAYLYVNEDMWTLDMNNGTVNTIRITDKNPNNPLCGIKGVDSKGDSAVICITRTPNMAIVQFKYASGVQTYRGVMN